MHSLSSRNEVSEVNHLLSYTGIFVTFKTNLYGAQKLV